MCSNLSINVLSGTQSILPVVSWSIKALVLTSPTNGLLCHLLKYLDACRYQKLGMIPLFFLLNALLLTSQHPSSWLFDGLHSITTRMNSAVFFMMMDCIPNLPNEDKDSSISHLKILTRVYSICSLTFFISFLPLALQGGFFLKLLCTLLFVFDPVKTMSIGHHAPMTAMESIKNYLIIYG